MDAGTALRLVIGLVLLIVGAEGLVRGASRLALAMGLSPLVVGLTIVALGTGSPELAVGVQAAFGGNADIALGNVVGSNIFNVLFVLGLSALITPLVVAQQLVRLDVPVLIGVSLLLLLLGLDGAVSRLDGLLLVMGGLLYTGIAVLQGRRESRAVQAEYAQEFGAPPLRAGWQLLKNVVLVVLGLVLLVLGARWLVAGAAGVARAWGVSDLVIGLTVVAAGTSLPEVATSVIASLRGERDIAVGNAIGSNIYNILIILGVSSSLVPDGIAMPAATLHFDMPVMLAVAIACLPIFFTGHRIARWEGAVFFSYYLVYLLYVLLKATEHDALPAVSTVMLAFVLPLTVVTFAVTVARHLRLPAAR